MPLSFGTDGIRGVANTELTPEVALAVGRAAARALGEGVYLVGRDTRRSGPMLQAALSAGLSSEGRDVVDVGVIPTPGIAWLAGERGVRAAMVSASHNPFSDNGIKLFDVGGAKLSLEAELAIQEVAAVMADGTSMTGRAEHVGTIAADADAVQEYIERLVTVADGAALPNGEVVIDCANGSASVIAPAVFARIGIRHHVLFASPHGVNINAGCGSTHLGPLSDEVVRRGAALGIAFDGDADRMLAVDHKGDMVDGDQLIAMFAKDLHGRDRLVGQAVVVTVLSNLGLRLGLETAGVSVIETPVGDRHVADALELGGYVLGGEQSGHLIFREHSSSGDGMLTALKLLELIGRTGSKLSELAEEAMMRLPQVLLNVPVPDPRRLAGAEAVWRQAEAVQAELGESGRVLLRESGTELCVRVMVEAPTLDLADRYAGQIADVVRRDLT
ncbi:MAG: phosphoglucosamine mutase [Acidimicrobiales bacterium]